MYDPLPSGDIEKSAVFTALSGSGVTGTVSIWRTNPDNERVLRIESLNSTFNSRNHLFIRATGETFPAIPLKSHLGNQNYYTGIMTAKTWISVELRTGSDPLMSTKIAEAVFP